MARVFLAPDDEPVDNGRSMLYFLRRDLQDQYGKEGGQHDKLISPLLTTLGIMLGFELLAKYWSGRHITNGKVLENFLEDVTKLSRIQSVILTQLRHALAHGYCLQTKNNNDGKMYTFLLSDNEAASMVIQEKDSKYTINIWQLKKLFIETIRKYQNLLAQSSDLEGKFVTTNANLGELKII